MNSIKKLLKPSKIYIVKNNRLIFAKNFEDYQGRLPSNPSIIRERLNPRLYDFSYLMTKSFLKTIKKFAQLVDKLGKSVTILDLGCGYKPFQALFPKNTQYIGVDITLNSYADIIADNHHLPFKDNTFDIIIASEILEHSSNEYQFIDELRRVSKNKALVYLSLPFIFPLHGIPHDFNRFTKYKLQELFKQDEIIHLQGSNNIFTSIFIYFNTFLRIIFGATRLLYPIYIINDLLGLIVEKFSKVYRNKKGFIGEYWDYALTAFPMGYSLIVRVKK